MRSKPQKKADARYEALGRRPRTLATVNITGIAAQVDAARGELSRAEWLRQAAVSALNKPA
jgi:hypothetical protein